MHTSSKGYIHVRIHWIQNGLKCMVNTFFSFISQQNSKDVSDIPFYNLNVAVNKLTTLPQPGPSDLLITALICFCCFSALICFVVLFFVSMVFLICYFFLFCYFVCILCTRTASANNTSSCPTKGCDCLIERLSKGRYDETFAGEDDNT